MPAPQNSLKAALAQGQVQIGLWIGLVHPLIAEIAASAGFDWCLIDAEHGPNTAADVLAQLQAIGSRAAPVVRVAANEPWLLKQVLDLGAQTVLVPMVETAEEAARAVAACCYPPQGIRGVASPIVRASGYGAVADYATTANDEICVIVQVETRSAAQRIDAIAAVAGVDAIFIGPADLSADMGFPGRPTEPEVLAEIDRLIERIRAAGKAAGIIQYDAATIARYAAAGVTFIGAGSDAGLIASTFRAVARSAREAIASSGR
ncbi:HpcH/HpaI aldolase/citrate lyase family protein [Methylobacterium oryzae]|uniref:HpcH/HpaI aldolase family protein n=1 Tax=Methylobacterium oryzae TaxID=334852 RepID=UPI002F2E18F2